MNKHEFSTDAQRRNACILVLSALVLVGLAGCVAPSAVQPTQTPTLTNTSEPTSEPALTNTPGQTPMAAPTNTSEPMALPEPTQTSEPTPSPEPTNTPEPTPSPEPTNTPEPTPAPESTPTETPGLIAPPVALPQAPVVAPAGEVTLEAGKRLAVTANAMGANRYEWTLSGDGKIESATGPATIYTAPRQGGGMAALSVIAYNDQGASPPTTLIINIPAMSSVRVDSLAVPAGWMSGGGAPQPYITVTGGAPACDRGTDCLHITYKPGGEWGGIYWWPPTCGGEGNDAAWAKVQQGACGVNVPQAGVLSTVDRLTFWARGEQGGEVIEFKVGGADVSPAPGRSLGKVELRPDWQPYAIDLKGMDLTNAIGLFAWISADIDNPQGAVFYLDDIQFEGVKEISQQAGGP